MYLKHGLRAAGFALTANVFAVGLFAVLSLATAAFISQRIQFTSQAQTSVIDMVVGTGSGTASGVTVNLGDPITSNTWDFLIKGDLCFGANPPLNGKYRIALTMDTLDATGNVVKTNIGASVQETLTNPATTRCDSRNLRKLQFNAPFNIPSPDKWVSACPEINVELEVAGNWRNSPAGTIAKINKNFLCPDDETETPTPSLSPIATTVPTAVPTGVPPTGVLTAIPTAVPTAVPTATATPTPTPVIDSITGRVSTYSCVQPDSIQVTVCTTDGSAKCTDIPFSATQTNQGVWPSDLTGDRTYIYDYMITQDPDGRKLEPGKKYSVKVAFGKIKLPSGGSKVINSSSDSFTDVTAPGGTKDFTIYALNSSCACTFKSTVYVKDADTGAITSVLDDGTSGANPQFGIANDMQIIKQANLKRDNSYKGHAVQSFTNGKNVVEVDLFQTTYNERVGFPYTSYGRDALASVRLFAPGYDVVKQECKSFGAQAGCPQDSTDWTKDAAGVGNRTDIVGLRVACGVDTEYGWVIKKLATTPAPTGGTNPTTAPAAPTQVPASGGAGGGTGGGSSEALKDVFNAISCVLRKDAVADAPENNGCRPVNFRLRSSRPVKEASVNFEWDFPANCPAHDRVNDQYLIVITDGQNVIATKDMIKESQEPTTNVDADQRAKSPLASSLSYRAIKYWEAGVVYKAYIYTMKSSDLACISKPATLSFSTSGAQLSDTFEVQELDVNGDGFINLTDWLICVDEFGSDTKPYKCDIDNNGTVNGLDRSIMIPHIGQSVNQSKE